MAEHVQLHVTGIEGLGDALTAFLDELAHELAPGFIPEHRYAGQGGEPFTLEAIDLVERRVGLA